jgi:hypothetical protein
MSKILEKFQAPDNKKLAAIANVLLYIAAPLGTLVVIVLRAKGKVDADTATDLIAAWGALIGGFKLATKFTENKEA